MIGFVVFWFFELRICLIGMFVFLDFGVLGGLDVWIFGCLDFGILGIFGFLGFGMRSVSASLFCADLPPPYLSIRPQS